MNQAGQVDGSIQNEQIAPGMYLYMIKDEQGNSKTGKVVVK